MYIANAKILRWGSRCNWPLETGFALATKHKLNLHRKKEMYIQDWTGIWSIPQKGANSDFFSLLGITLLNFVSSGNFWYQIIQVFQGYLAYPTFPHFIPLVKMPEAKTAFLGHFLPKNIISSTSELKYLIFDYELRT